MREAQSLDLITSATNVFGFGEGALERVEHLVRVRDMQDEAIARGERPFTSFMPGRSNLRRIPSVDGTEDRTVWNLVLDRRNTFVTWPLLVSCSTWSITSKRRGLRWASMWRRWLSLVGRTTSVPP